MRCYKNSPLNLRAIPSGMGKVIIYTMHSAEFATIGLNEPPRNESELRRFIPNPVNRASTIEKTRKTPTK